MFQARYFVFSRTLARLAHTIAFAAILIGAATASAAGLLSPADGAIPPLTIKDHHVNVLIQDEYAITEVEQSFFNPHPTDLEAIYSFPIPENAAVAEFTMWIDGKPIIGEVMKKEEAKNVYTKEKEAGRDAGLTEQDGHKTFDISVYPVRAGKETRIRIVYMQALKTDHGVASYLYPLEEGGVDEEKLRFWSTNPEVAGAFSFDLKLRSASAVEAVRLPAHPAAIITQAGPGEWGVHLDNQGPMAQSQEGAGAGKVAPATSFRLDKDIVVYYRLPASLPPSVSLVAYKPSPEKPGVFMMTLTPGDDLKPIPAGADWIFVLDLSGSMEGKYGALAEGVAQAITRMRDGDRFRIIAFNQAAWEITKGYTPATEANRRAYIDTVKAQTPGGSTNLFDGLTLGLTHLDADRPCAIILVTDGEANVGETSQRAFVELARKKDVRLYTFVMGNSANRPLLEALTEASGGFSMAVSNSDDIIGKILVAKSKVTHQALNNATLKITGVKAAELTPAKIGAVYRGQRLTLFGRYFGGGKAQVELSGKVGAEARSYKTAFDFPETSAENPELERLWALARITEMKREIDNFGPNPDLKTGIEDLAVEYGLVTDYTSMVVVGEEVFKKLGIDRKNLARRDIELAAAQSRSNSAPRDRRVDSASPMFTGSQASVNSSGAGGAGAVDGIYLLTLLFMAALALFKKGWNLGRV
ncbi:MAG: VIT and VWA domain-containing protein [Nitrospinota bacterium]|nr:VIT and VWA domain-containing protein [Nitrospinota bacterium]